MPGYTRSFNRANGEVIEAPDFVNEYEALDSAFDANSGHAHDGSTGHGAYVPLISGPLNRNEIRVDNINNELVFSINVGATKVEQARFADGVLYPTVDADIDLGTVAKKLKNIYAAGTTNTSILQLNLGSAVSAIRDEDDMLSNSNTALATQQSIKAYVDNNVLAHTHDGVSGSIVNLIASNDELNVVEIDDTLNRVVFSVDVASVKTGKLTLDAAALLPVTDNDINLGGAGNRFAQAWAQTVRADNLQFAIGVNANSILDEDDMVSNSSTALATQQSIKKYIDDTVAAEVLAHSHDGITSATLAILQSPDGLNRISINDPANRIAFQVDIAGVATSRCAVDADALYPATDLAIDLGKDNHRYTNGYFDTVHATVGKIVRQTVPATAVGASGDLAGMIAADSTHVYLCHTDYDGVSNIWSRVAITSW